MRELRRAAHRRPGLAARLVLPDETRVPLTGTLNIGRAADSEVRLDDRTVSRRHVRIGVDGDRVWIEDAGSSHGSFLDGRRLERRTPVNGPALVRLGDVELRFERHRREEPHDDTAPGRTIIVRPGATLHVPAVGASTIDRSATSHGLRPRVRSGWALKRLGAAEGAERFMLRDLRGGGYVRMGADAAALFELLDGRSDLADLVAEAERRFGPAGPGRLASLLADLGERGLLAASREPSRRRRRDGGPAPPSARARAPRARRPVRAPSTAVAASCSYATRARDHRPRGRRRIAAFAACSSSARRRPSSSPTALASGAWSSSSHASSSCRSTSSRTA